MVIMYTKVIFMEIWLVIMYTYGNHVYQSLFRGNMAGNNVYHGNHVYQSNFRGNMTGNYVYQW